MGSKLITDYLFIWIIFSVVIGFLVPQLTLLQFLSPVILVIMIGSISMTLSLDNFYQIEFEPLTIIFVSQLFLPIIALGIAALVSLSYEFTIGLVFLAAVTPELMSPVMTELADGNTALSTTILVISGFSITLAIPIYLHLIFGETLEFDLFSVFVNILILVLLPMMISVFLRSWKTEVIEQYDQIYPTISAIMVIIIMAIVTSTNAQAMLNNFNRLPPIILGALLLNLAAYVLGYLASTRLSRENRISAVFSLGMRDFAVAIALILSAKFDPIIAIPAIIFGIIEIVSSSLLVTLIRKY